MSECKSKQKIRDAFHFSKRKGIKHSRLLLKDFEPILVACKLEKTAL